jgi:hypothetical protein
MPAVLDGLLPLSLSSSAAVAVEKLAPQQRRPAGQAGKQQSRFHCVRRLRCSRLPSRSIPNRPAATTLLDQSSSTAAATARRQFAAFSCPAIETGTTDSSRGSGGRSDLAAGRCQCYMYLKQRPSSATSPSKTWLEKKIRYRFNLRACNSYAQVEQRVGTA